MTVVRKTQLLSFVIFFFCLFPILNISGAYVSFQELALLSFLCCILLLGRIDWLWFKNTTPYLCFFVAYIIAILLSGIMSSEYVNSFDIYNLRQILQLILLFVFLQVISNNGEHLPKGNIFNLIIAIILIVGFLKLLAPTEIKNVLNHIYFSEFGYLSESEFEGFRTSSIFKNFFNASVAYVFIAIFLVYKTAYNYQNRLPIKGPIILFFLIGLISVFTGRTASLFIFLLMIGTLMRALFIRNLRFYALTIVIFLLVFILSTLLYLSSIGVDLSWFLELFLLFQGDVSSFSSVQDMNSMNNNFIAYIYSNPMILLQPNHTYDLKYTVDDYYTDSFYLQELYRYGIYGVLALLTLYIYIARDISRSNGGLFSLFYLTVLISFVALNYKGGNVFIMERNIYIYGCFIWFASHKFSMNK